MLKQLQSIDPAREIEIVLNGAEHRGPFQEPDHTYGYDLYKGVLNAVSAYKVKDLAFDDDYRMLSAIDLTNGDFFAWDENKEQTHLFEAVNLAMMPQYAIGNTVKHLEKITALNDKIDKDKKRLPALQNNWQKLIGNVRESLEANKGQITQDIQHWSERHITLNY